VIDSSATPTGNGYYMVAADGGLFAFGDAVYRKSVPEVLPGVTLNAPVVAITVTDTNAGYRMVAADGGVFNFGNSPFHGSLGSTPPPVDVSTLLVLDGGYVMFDRNGTPHPFGSGVAYLS
jgi:hypothetical protein